jgi:electron transfer flavoprotein beta subunit
VLLSDRRLAASDTLATAYALYKTVSSCGAFDLVFCGLQTTDGDTAQVGPQLAERLGIPQVTYCEWFEITDQQLHARRVVEGGSQYVTTGLPAVVTVANAYERLAYQTLRGAQRVQHLQRDDAARNQVMRTVNLDDIGADPERCGLKGSPTIVAATEKVGEIGGRCVLYQGKSPEALVQELLKAVPELVKS